MTKFKKITSYIPQREPIVMISKLIEVSETKAVTKFFIDKNNIFCTNQFFDESGIIENIAQTAAALTGYNAKLNNQKVKKGFIGSVDNLKIYNLPKYNQEIETIVNIENIVIDVHIIKGTVWLGTDIIAECNMKIFLEK